MSKEKEVEEKEKKKEKKDPKRKKEVQDESSVEGISERDYKDVTRCTQQLLRAIVEGDWKTYASLTDPSVTCFEPEGRGHLIEGLDFHKFYFELRKPAMLPSVTSQDNFTLSNFRVRMLGNAAAIVSYVRLAQRQPESGAPPSPVSVAEETRIWRKISSGHWLQVHFHRSVNS